MKGIVFRSFLGLFERTFEDDITEQMIADWDLPSGGSYPTAGTFDPAELLSLISGFLEGYGDRSIFPCQEFW